MSIDNFRIHQVDPIKEVNFSNIRRDSRKHYSRPKKNNQINTEKRLEKSFKEVFSEELMKTK